MLQQKRESFWQAKVDAEKSSSRQLWHSVDTLLGRGSVPLCDEIDADQFHQFFDEKVAGVQAATANVPPPTIKSSTSAATLLQFQAVTADEVTAAVHVLPDKCYVLDPLQTKLQKVVVDLVAPFIVEVFNRSLYRRGQELIS